MLKCTHLYEGERQRTTGKDQKRGSETDGERERESETDTERVWKTDAELQVTDMMSLLLLSLNCY